MEKIIFFGKYTKRDFIILLVTLFITAVSVCNNVPIVKFEKPEIGSISIYKEMLPLFQGGSDGCEAGQYVSVLPGDFGFPNTGVFDGSLNASNIDISSKWGLPTGSVLISVTGASARSSSSFVVGDGFPIEFTFSGTVPVFVRPAHSSRLRAGVRDGIIAQDGVEYEFISSLPEGVITVNEGDNFYLENTTGVTIDEKERHIWQSQSEVTSIQFYTTDPDVDNGIAILISPVICPDTDGTR